MKAISLATVFALLSLSASSTHHHPVESNEAVSFLNLDSEAKTFAQQMCVKLGRVKECYDQIDMHGKTKGDLRVKVEGQPFHYTLVKPKDDKPVIRTTILYQDKVPKKAEGQEDLKFTYKRSDKHNFAFEWTVKSGIQSEGSEIYLPQGLFGTQIKDFSGLQFDIDLESEES